MPVDYYEVLGVNKDTPTDEIKKVYKDLARKYHPDCSSEDNCEDKMKEINEAYNIIGDEEKRKQYDFQQAGGGNFGGFGFESIFENMGFNPFQQRQQRVRPNTDILLRKQVNLRDLLSPINETITYERVIVCSECNGVGGTDSINCVACAGQGVIQTKVEQGFMSFVQSRTCDRCRGTGKIYQNSCSKCHSFGLIKEPVNEQITIPLGCLGKHLVLQGMGNIENSSVRPGNLIIEIGLIPDDIYKTEGYSCVCSLSIDPVEAMLGGEFKINSLEGNELVVKIPKGCAPGYREEFKQLGIPTSETERGSLFAEVVYDIPKELSEGQELLLKTYVELLKEVE